eukprot:4315712-Alexandrium_andersonii.AAC.1
MAIKPDNRLGQTEQHDVRMRPMADRRRIAMRMLQRITFRQRKAKIDINGFQWVLHGADAPDDIFGDVDCVLEQ